MGKTKSNPKAPNMPMGGKMPMKGMPKMPMKGGKKGC